MEKLLRRARDGDAVVVHSMDRLARNLDDLRPVVQKLTRIIRCADRITKGKLSLHQQRLAPGWRIAAGGNACLGCW